MLQSFVVDVEGRNRFRVPFRNKFRIQVVDEFSWFSPKRWYGSVDVERMIVCIAVVDAWVALVFRCFVH